jgi:hypothetical protein
MALDRQGGQSEPVQLMVKHSLRWCWSPTLGPAADVDRGVPVLACCGMDRTEHNEMLQRISYCADNGLEGPDEPVEFWKRSETLARAVR